MMIEPFCIWISFILSGAVWLTSAGVLMHLMRQWIRACRCCCHLSNLCRRRRPVDLISHENFRFHPHPNIEKCFFTVLSFFALLWLAATCQALVYADMIPLVYIRSISPVSMEEINYLVLEIGADSVLQMVAFSIVSVRWLRAVKIPRDSANEAANIIVNAEEGIVLRNDTRNRDGNDNNDAEASVNLLQLGEGRPRRRKVSIKRILHATFGIVMLSLIVETILSVVALLTLDHSFLCKHHASNTTDVITAEATIGEVVAVGGAWSSNSNDATAPDAFHPHIHMDLAQKTTFLIAAHTILNGAAWITNAVILLYCIVVTIGDIQVRRSSLRHDHTRHLSYLVIVMIPLAICAGFNGARCIEQYLLHSMYHPGFARYDLMRWIVLCWVPTGLILLAILLSSLGWLCLTDIEPDVPFSNLYIHQASNIHAANDDDDDGRRMQPHRISPLSESPQGYVPPKEMVSSFIPLDETRDSRPVSVVVADTDQQEVAEEETLSMFDLEGMFFGLLLPQEFFSATAV